MNVVLEQIKAFFCNYLLMSAVVAWLIAQIIKIFTGLSGVVEIKTGKRTIMEYFLEPITKGFGESLKEK